MNSYSIFSTDGFITFTNTLYIWYYTVALLYSFLGCWMLRCLKAPSPIFDYQNNPGHTTTVENFRIRGTDGSNMARAIKEAIYIRVNNPTLNKTIGKYNLPHIWDRFLYSISELKIANNNFSTITSVLKVLYAIPD